MKESELTYRDILAKERTLLANERTVLAYIRTFIGMVGSSAALLKIFDVQWARPIAWALLTAAPFVLCLGLYRYYSVNKRLNAEISSME